MGKYILLICAFISLTACAAEDEAYYRNNPQLLQEAVKNCPNKKSAKMSCEQLNALAANVNEMAYQLQINPQAFGRKILELQEVIAKQQADLKSNPNQPELVNLITKNKQNLADRLAIVKWLESPES